jgi:hypothetical protein
MKAWKKGALIGGLWGLLSLIIVSIISVGAMVEIPSENNISISDSKLITIIIFPTFLMLYLFENLIKGFSGLRIGSIPAELFIILILTIIIGASIGSIIGWGIEKFKQRGEDK